jgi:cell division transport system permease protein
MSAANSVENGSSARPRGAKARRLLPRESGAISLDLVIGVMAFLAALAIASVLVANRTAQGWRAGLVGRLTVQILPVGEAAPEGEVAAALTLLRATPGIVRAVALSDADNLALVEPWLGKDTVIADLPFPRVIDVETIPGAAVDSTALAHRLKEVAPHAVLDDHGRWVDRLKAASGAVVWSALVILVLIAVATAATVAFATRAGLAAHREIVMLLHLMGAQDRFIARAFEWHYFIAALMAGLIGALAATFAFLAVGELEQMGVASVPFLPPLGLNLAELPWLLLVPVAASAIAWATARLSVVSALREFY